MLGASFGSETGVGSLLVTEPKLDLYLILLLMGLELVLCLVIFVVFDTPIGFLVYELRGKIYSNKHCDKYQYKYQYIPLFKFNIKHIEHL